MDFTAIFEALSPVIVQALTIIIMALAGLIGNSLRKWAKSKELNELVKTHKAWAALAVRTAEDIFDTGEGDQKLAYAYEWMSDRLKEYKIKLEPSEIQGLVRAAYQEIIGEFVEYIYEEIDEDDDF